MKNFRLAVATAATVVLACVIASYAALAQSRPAGQRPGGDRPQRFPVKLHPHDIDKTFIRMPLGPGQEKYGRIQGDRLKEFVREVTAISLQSRDAGDLMWGRIAGTKYDDLSEALVEKKFKELGLQDINRQYFDLPPQWFPVSMDFSVTGGGKTLKFETLQVGRGAASTPDNGLDLQVVWVGLGNEADFLGRDVKGKLVLLKSYPTPSVVGHSAGWNSALQRAAEKGAAAVLINLAIPGNVRTAMGSARGLPTFSIGTEDMTALQQLVEQGPVTAHVKLKTETRPGLRDATVWGTLPGTTDEDIIVMAHHDAFFEGATDNASGMAVMLGLAEYFSKVPKAERRRTLKFATTAGHHAGSEGTKWLHDNKATALAKTALLINCEHVSAIQMHFDRFGPGLRRSNNLAARRWWVNGSDRLAALVLGAYQTFGVTVYETMDDTTTGDMSHIDRDAPSIQLIESPLFYHTDRDRPDYVPAQGLEAVARAYARIIDDVNKLDRPALMPAPMAPQPSGAAQAR